ncbi:threonine--tRNA ligase, partial [Candidatus Woesearchaeota archaeon]|nr:threonine--tRNA ligase [Candidatus Woesearchaeota archaeon]
PGGILIYKSRLHSYRELPVRNAEFGLVHRHELSGVLNGLFRARSFTQDDAHIFCTEDQMEQEITELIAFTLEVYRAFGFTSEMFIATRPEKYIGSEKMWETATSALINAMKNKSIPFGIKEGEGAFYGPKIEFNVKDSLKRNWQCGTIQVDFSMPERFEVTYEGSDGKKHIPVMIHRAVLGAIERFIGILIEHFAGKLPLWLNPIQVKIMTVADRNLKFAEQVLMELKENNVRAELDDRSESIPKKVRDAQLAKVNYMLTIGDKEEQNKTLAIRTREGKVEFNVKVSDFVNEIVQEIRNRSN